MPEDDLLWALKQWEMNWRRQRYLLYRSYDYGDHRLAFATEKFRTTFGNLFKEFAENACPAVVDSLNDRLIVKGFQSSLAETVTEEVTGNGSAGVPGRKKVTVDDPHGRRAWELWETNRMDLAANEVHRESLLMGDSYVVVWPNEEMYPEIYPQLATECAVEYDRNRKNWLTRGAKVWFEEVEKKWRLNIYLPDRIEKYTVKRTPDTMPLKAADWVKFEADTPNPYERVPIFHFPNRKTRCYGISELKDVIPLQDGLNKSVMDMLIAMEFASFKQRYIIGLDPEIDETTGEPKDQTARNYGVDRMMAIPDPDSKVGQFDATDLGQFLRVQEKFWASVSRVSGTPLHYFFITSGDFPSGEAMKAAEARFVKKITDQQTAKGNVWEDVLKFCMMIEGETPEDLQLETHWIHAAPRSESELADTAVKKKAVGVSRSQLLKELGYSDEEITRMLEESDAEAEAQMAAQTEQQKAVQESRQRVGENTGTRTGGTQGVRR